MMTPSYKSTLHTLFNNAQAHIYVQHTGPESGLFTSPDAV